MTIRERQRACGRNQSSEHTARVGQAVSLAEWRAIAACMAEVYAYYERQLAALAEETLGLFTTLLHRRGLSPRLPAARPTTLLGPRAVPPSEPVVRRRRRLRRNRR